MGFPIPQHRQMQEGADLTIDLDIALDACHVTTVPPFVKDMPGIVHRHTSFVSSLNEQYPDCRTAFFYGLQHPPENATEEDLLVLKGLGIRFMTLAYDGASEYGGGFTNRHCSLTERGRWLVEAMGNVGIVLDLSHAGHLTARDAIQFIQDRRLPTRVVATHTGCYSVYTHDRNLPDDVLIHINRMKGFVGLVTVTWLLHVRDNTMVPFLNHLRYLQGIVEFSSICLGTDGIYTRLSEEEARVRFEMMTGKLDADRKFNARMPEEPPPLMAPDKLPLIHGVLERENMSTSLITDIMGRRFIQYLEEL